MSLHRSDLIVHSTTYLYVTVTSMLSHPEFQYEPSTERYAFHQGPISKVAKLPVYKWHGVYTVYTQIIDKKRIKSK